MPVITFNAMTYLLKSLALAEAAALCVCRRATRHLPFRHTCNAGTAASGAARLSLDHDLASCGPPPCYDITIKAVQEKAVRLKQHPSQQTGLSDFMFLPLMCISVISVWTCFLFFIFFFLD